MEAEPRLADSPQRRTWAPCRVFIRPPIGLRQSISARIAHDAALNTAPLWVWRCRATLRYPWGLPWFAPSRDHKSSGFNAACPLGLGMTVWASARQCCIDCDAGHAGYRRQRGSRMATNAPPRPKQRCRAPGGQPRFDSADNRAPRRVDPLGRGTPRLRTDCGGPLPFVYWPHRWAVGLHIRSIQRSRAAALHGRVKRCCVLPSVAAGRGAGWGGRMAPGLKAGLIATVQQAG